MTHDFNEMSIESNWFSGNAESFFDQLPEEIQEKINNLEAEQAEELMLELVSKYDEMIDSAHDRFHDTDSFITAENYEA